MGGERKKTQSRLEWEGRNSILALNKMTFFPLSQVPTIPYLYWNMNDSDKKEDKGETVGF